MGGGGVERPPALNPQMEMSTIVSQTQSHEKRCKCSSKISYLDEGKGGFNFKKKLIEYQSCKMPNIWSDASSGTDRLRVLSMQMQSSVQEISSVNVQGNNQSHYTDEI